MMCMSGPYYIEEQYEQRCRELEEALRACRQEIAAMKGVGDGQVDSVGQEQKGTERKPLKRRIADMVPA